MQIEKSGRRGRVARESTRSAFTRCAQQVASKFAVVPKRLVNLANAARSLSGPWLTVDLYIDSSSKDGQRRVLRLPWILPGSQ